MIALVRNDTISLRAKRAHARLQKQVLIVLLEGMLIFWSKLQHSVTFLDSSQYSYFGIERGTVRRKCLAVPNNSVTCS